MPNGCGVSIPSVPNDPFPNIPQELKDCDQWVLWRLEPSPKNPEKFTKIPYSAKGNFKASSTTPTSWSSYKQAIFTLQDRPGFYNGIGFVFSPRDKFIGIDYDHIIKDGVIDPEVLAEVRELNSYTEISQSGTGLHVIGIGEKTGKFGEDREVYDTGRYFAITGNVIPGSPSTINNIQDTLNRIYERIKKPSVLEEQIPKTRTNYNSNISETYNLRVEEIARPINPVDHNNGQLQGEHPFHGSTTGMNFSINTKDNVWHCFRHQSGGGPLELFALKEGIIQCHEAGPGCLSGKWQDVFNALERTGYKKKEEVKPKQPKEPKAPVLTNTDTLEGYKLTGGGNAKRFVDRYFDDVRYCAPHKSWYIWNGEIWQKDEYGKITLFAKTVVKSMFDESLACLDDNKRNVLLRHSMKTDSRAGLSEMVELAEPELIIRREDLDSDPNLVNCQNGTLELDTQTFREFRKSDFLSMKMGASYDKEAKCPLWMDHLNLVFKGDTSTINGFKRVCGYSLLFGNPEQIFNILWGNGKNGKSVTLLVLNNILGDYAANIPAESLMVKKSDGPRTDLAGLTRSRFVTSTEGESGARFAESLIKQVSGCDKITCRFLYEREFTYTPGFKVFFATNHKPEILGTDEGIWRRIVLWEFTCYIERADPHIVEKLMQEAPGILNWLIEGLKEYFLVGLDLPPSVITATQNYKDECDVVGLFISHTFTIERDRSVARKELYELFKIWCQENGEVNPRGDPGINNKSFFKILRDMSYLKEGYSKGSRCFWGIRLKTAAEIQDMIKTGTMQTNI